MLGNLGEAKNKCSFKFTQTDMDKHDIGCKEGVISSLNYYGMLPSTETKDYSYDFCGNESKHELIHNCTSQYLNSRDLIFDFNATCVSQSHCQFNLNKYVRYGNNQSACTNEDSNVYIQYSC